MSTAPAKAPSKTSRVRAIVKELGYGVQDPPSDWKKQVVKALRKEKIKVTDKIIYNCRRDLLAGKGNDPAPQDRYVGNGNTELPNVTLKDAQRVIDLANEFGGINNLRTVIDAVADFAQGVK